MVSGKFCGSTEEGMDNSVSGFGYFMQRRLFKIGQKVSGGSVFLMWRKYMQKHGDI